MKNVSSEKSALFPMSAASILILTAIKLGIHLDLIIGKLFGLVNGKKVDNFNHFL